MSGHSAVAFVPARSGSERVPHKNVRPLAGHPLLAYAIETALQSGCFERVVVSTDSEEIADIARWYGADVPFLRPGEYATSTSPDIEWLSYTLEHLDGRYDLFALVRATNPFRGPDAVRRGLEQLLATPEADSLRAVELVKQHPGKMWLVSDDGRTMIPLLDQSDLDVAWHAGQYQALPEIYVQNSALEIAWTRVVSETRNARGRGARTVPHARARGVQRRRRGGLGARGQARRERGGDAARGRTATVSSRSVKVASLETLYCDAGWRPWIFLKATTDDGLVGWAEITDSHGSPRGLAGIVEDLAPLVVGRDPRAVEAIYWDLYRAHPAEPGLGHREGARRDRERAPRHQGEGARRPRLRALRRTDARVDPDVLVALRHDASARVGGDGHAEARFVRRRRRTRARGRRAGLRRVQDERRRPRRGAGGAHARLQRGRRHVRARTEIADALVAAARGFRARALAARRAPIVDLNFNLEPEGCLRVAKALEPFDLLWLEVDLFDPAALAHVRHVAPMPICSGENLYSSRGFRPFSKRAGWTSRRST